MADPDETLAAYADLYTRLTRENVTEIRALCQPGIRFTDPFSTVTGVDRYEAVLRKMFDDVIEPAFAVHDHVRSVDRGYIRWTFTFRTKPGAAPWVVEGMSEVIFGADGLIAEHMDHWDSGAQFYARLPVIGAVIRWIRGRVGVH